MPVRASEGMEPYADFAPRVCQKPNTLAVYLQFYLGSILQVNQQNWKRKKTFSSTFDSKFNFGFYSNILLNEKLFLCIHNIMFIKN